MSQSKQLNELNNKINQDLQHLRDQYYMLQTQFTCLSKEHEINILKEQNKFDKYVAQSNNERYDHVQQLEAQISKLTRDHHLLE
jgi:hypothetical protein